MHMLPMYPTRLDSSPALYFLKKSTGRDSTRIITALSTASSILVVMPALRMLRMTDSRVLDSITHSRVSTAPASSTLLPSSSTGPYR